ncbi:MAG: sulfatase [Planctomycetota bacterium]|nr:sulfatase [Planctomycetota bacterium]
MAAIAPACAPERKPAPASERVTVRLDLERVRAGLADPNRPRWDFDGTWVLQETRDAVRAAWGEPVAFPVLEKGTLEVACAFAVAGAAPANARERIAFEVRLVASGRDEVVSSSECTLAEAAEAWHELHGRVRVDARGATELSVVARWLGSEPPPEGARPVHAVPHARAVQPERRNVLVISVDTLRADHLGFHGYARPTSPRLDAFVARGAVFEQAISTSPWTLPSYGTLFTGLEPARHRAGLSARREAAFGQDRDAASGDYQALVAEAPTLAGTFAAAGWSTGAFVSNPFLDPASGIDRGFESFAQYLNRAQAGVDLASRWIEARGGAPWFLFLHLMDPHTPYTPPAPYDTRFRSGSFRAAPGYPPSLDQLRAAEPSREMKDLLVDSYDGEIAYTDAQIGRFLDFLRDRGELDRTIVVLHADHGEEFWEHGSFEHGHSLNEESLHVPLAFVAPGLVAGGLRIRERTSTVNVFATVLELAGLAVPAANDGASLAGSLRADRAPGARAEPRPCISEATLYGPRERKAWSTATEKFITDGAAGNQLFDLATDPLERVDLSADRADRGAELRTLLRRRTRALLEQRGAGEEAEFDRDRRADLERLGYPGADPK